MNKLLSMLIIGPFMALFPIIILFIGVKHNYFDALGIEVFFNHIFFASFPTVLFVGLSVMFAVIYVLFKKMHIAAIITVLFLALSVISLVPPMGMQLGQYMYEKKPFHIKHGHFMYKGVLQYESVNFYYLLDEDANRTLKFTKGDVIEAY